jgi:hypothetical protein
MKVRVGLLTVSLTLLWSAAATAVPPPKTPAEMLALADLVVDAKGITIVCDGKPIDSPQKTVTNYLSTLYPSKSYKGGSPKSFQIRGKVETWKTTPPVGGWFQGPVAEGWVGKLYLKKQSDGTYSKVWWNAETEDKALSKPKPLPTCAAPSDGGMPDSAPAKDSAPVTDSAPATDSQPGVDSHQGSDSATADGGTVTPPPLDDDGCSCSAGRGLRGAPVGLVLALLGLCLLRRRRA